MGVVLELLAFEINVAVFAATSRWRAILGFEALDGGPCFNESTIDCKVLTRQQVLPFGLCKDTRQKLGGNIGTDQSFLILAKAGMIPNRFFHSHAEKPAVEEVVVVLLYQLPIAADGIQNHQQLGFQKFLRWNRAPAGSGVHAVKDLVHTLQGFISHGAYGTQEMILGTKDSGVT